MITKQRTLWRVTESTQNTTNRHADYDKKSEIKAVLDTFSKKCPQQSLWTLFCSSLVVGQEFALVCLLLAGHRAALLEQEEEVQSKLVPFMMAGSLALLIIVQYSETTTPSSKMMMMRGADAILIAGTLCLLSAVFKALTSSYTYSTIQALAIAGFIVHLFVCDYSYANGLSRSIHITSDMDHGGREPFLERTLSFNAVLFSTTLLASRIPSNATTYLFVSATVILFAFYPAARHSISKQPQAPYVCLAISSALWYTLWVLLSDTREKMFCTWISIAICAISPAWKYHIQSRKFIISGPWDIAQISVEKI